MSSLQILVIDDEPAIRQILVAVLVRAGYPVDEADCVTGARARLAKGDVDVALCDITMPDGNGLDLLREARAAKLETVFVMITGSSSISTVVESLRAGAFDYLTKPVRNEEVLHRLAQIDAMRGLREENRALRRVVSEKTASAFPFTSPAMQRVERLADKVAPTDSTVLIVGESGTGKGVLAQAIQTKSPRSKRPFVTVNCSAIPEQLLESEFFGHTKGAFTGADRPRKGLFAEADGGTLFLDEIGELPMPMQTKLLHAIEGKQVRPIGSEQAKFVDTRIIAATNRDLPAMIKQGAFREDLYFRLSMFQIAIPPLRERQADIRALAQYLMKGARNGSHSRDIEIDPEAETYLLAYSWPGNVRELDNVIKRARILAENDCISVADLPAALVSSVDRRLVRQQAIDGAGSLREQLSHLEADIITRAIGEADGDRRTAAQKLGFSLSSLYRKLGDAVRVEDEPH